MGFIAVDFEQIIVFWDFTIFAKMYASLTSITE